MGGMWKAATEVSTPIALLAFLIGGWVAIIGWHKWRQYAAIKGTTDQDKRAEMLRDILGRFAPDMSNLTRDQKAGIIHRQITFGFVKSVLFIGAGVIITLAIIYAGVLMAENKGRAGQEPKNPDENVALKAEGPPLPLARIDNFGGTALIHEGGDKYRNGEVYELFDPRVMRNVGKAYPVIAFDLVKPRPGTVKLDGTRLIWMPVELRVAAGTGTAYANFKPPLTFLAKLNRKNLRHVSETVANIKFGDGITDGSIDFSDELPVRKCRIEFEGTPGQYIVDRVELDLTDVRTGEKVTLKSPHGVFIYLPPKSP